MVRKALLALVLLSVLAGLGACGGGQAGGSGQAGGKPTSQESAAQTFVNNLFAGKFDEAKALAVPSLAADAKASVDAFAGIANQYQFQEINVASYRPWGYAGNPEQDRRVEVRFQYKAKTGNDDWHIGYFELHVLNEKGQWGTGEIEFRMPSAG